MSPRPAPAGSDEATTAPAARHGGTPTPPGPRGAPGGAGPGDAHRTHRSGRGSRLDPGADEGFAGGAEALPFGVLIFVVGTLMVANLWGVIDTKMATDAAAREGARLVAESDGPGAAPARLGEEAARSALSAHGREPGRALTYRVTYEQGDEPGRWAPCARATVRVAYPAPLISLPVVGLAAGSSVTVSSTHSEIVDPYRSRATDPGEGGC